MVMSHRDCLTIVRTVMLEVIVRTSDCVESCVVNMESHSSVLKGLWKEAERSLVDSMNRGSEISCMRRDI